MIIPKRIDTDAQENLNEVEKKLDTIFEELLSNCNKDNSIKKFDHIVKSKLDYNGLLPISKSFEGERILSLSKTWMILILIKITKGKKQQNEFLYLVNSSLTHNLNDYNQYKNFYEDYCEILFSDEEAISRINLNPKLKSKIDININHDQLKSYYIYLLFNPRYFQKTFLDELQKIKKIFVNESTNYETDTKNKKKKKKTNNDKDEILDGNDIKENLEKEKINNQSNKKCERINKIVQRRLKYAKKRKESRKYDKIQNKSQKEKKGDNIDDDVNYLGKDKNPEEKKLKKNLQNNKISKYFIKSENKKYIEDSDEKEQMPKYKYKSGKINKNNRENKEEKGEKLNKTEKKTFYKTKKINNMSDKEERKGNSINWGKKINRKSKFTHKSIKNYRKKKNKKIGNISKSKKVIFNNNEEDIISEDETNNNNLVKLNTSKSESNKEDSENIDEALREMDIKDALEGYLGHVDINDLFQNSKIKEIFNLKSEDSESDIYLEDDDDDYYYN